MSFRLEQSTEFPIIPRSCRAPHSSLPSSRGPGHSPLKASTPVRIRLGAPIKSRPYVRRGPWVVYHPLPVYRSLLSRIEGCKDHQVCPWPGFVSGQLLVPDHLIQQVSAHTDHGPDLRETPRSAGARGSRHRVRVTIAKRTATTDRQAGTARIEAPPSALPFGPQFGPCILSPCHFRFS
jgi:hypothetical protein